MLSARAQVVAVSGHEKLAISGQAICDTRQWKAYMSSEEDLPGWQGVRRGRTIWTESLASIDGTLE